MMKTSVAVLCMMVIAAIACGVGFLGGGYYASSTMTREVNDVAGGNFQTAVAVFREDYEGKRMVLFGEDGRRESFTIGAYHFDVVPAAATQVGGAKDGFNGGMSNVAAHLNGLVVMLACKWMEDGNPAGRELLAKLRDHMPDFKLSSPGISPVKVMDLEANPEMIRSEADQWEWRVENDPR